ncbi:hypothetical protein CC1G_05107 [Coprinopsis cinerea okayama7|uniref:Major facilitator superfamily (MFS) profile domain-containing protein n=1 Tax=Coprinopsis cinerea (strain Okayama-7 / 130 / ATCC MYA-4618 / FGSC 9003) TaxID=240176 RepID=A8NGC8_COPC7|nr:hypothetical protein CC1G_05107 [Coprinopsis cinerea okayama7\|eukprot:XP_001833407.2 hypothetical protein CC1G_05107 [Coprinopsis cinerea okayama7\
MTTHLVADSDIAVVDRNTPAPYKTPLPKLQLAILCSVRLTDPICFTGVFPYINELLSRLHLVDNPAHIGFYSGLVESTFAFFQLISIYEWTKISDKVGRRPVVIWGSFGLSIATIGFGFTSNLWSILFTRALAGLFSGNAAVLHSILGELTDTTNQHIAFPIYGLFWPLGSILGPIIGGSLADPAKKYPKLFNYALFKEYPYFLPCFAAGLIAFGTAAAAGLFLRETHPNKQRSLCLQCHRSINFATELPDAKEERITMKELLKVPIMRSLTISGASLCFTATAFDAVFVLFCYTAVAEGGLGFSTSQIGYALAMAGSSSILIQILFLPTLLVRFEPARLYNFCMWLWPLCYIVLPALRVIVHSPFLLWVAIGFVLTVSRVACLAYSISMILVKNHAPSPYALGQSNGLVMFAMCGTRALAPAFVSSIYALSHKDPVAGGYLWVVLMVLISTLGCSLAGSIEHPEGQIQLHQD